MFFVIYNYTFFRLKKGPTGMVGAFDTSSVSDTSLPAAIAFCQRCESLSCGVIELRVVSEIVLELRQSLLNNQW